MQGEARDKKICLYVAVTVLWWQMGDKEMKEDFSGTPPGKTARLHATSLSHGLVTVLELGLLSESCLSLSPHTTIPYHAIASYVCVSEISVSTFSFTYLWCLGNLALLRIL